MIYVLSGGEKIRSIIYVTYPAGSICTCKNGTKTLKAKDTSGKALFNVPPGSWTVTAASGSNTKSQTVTVTEGTATLVELKFSLVLFDDGTDNTAVTGGWTKSPNAQGRLYASALAYNGTGTGEVTESDTTTSKNSIDLSQYTILRFYDVKIETKAGTLGATGATVKQSPGTYAQIDVDISSITSGKITLNTTAYSYSGYSGAEISVGKIELI